MKRAARIALGAVIVGVDGDTPRVVTVPSDEGASLPSGRYDPDHDPTLDQGLRRFAREQAGLRLDYVEQLYTFGDAARREADGTPLVSIGYLALVGRSTIEDGPTVDWSGWYEHFPWEDMRAGTPALLSEHLLPALTSWVALAPDHRRHEAALRRRDRFAVAFGCEHDRPDELALARMDEEKVLERYELLFEAALVAEATGAGNAGGSDGRGAALVPSGVPMRGDHRRILATAMARLRGKLKYRPVVFELMPESFTLTALQETVEALAGRRLHKQNFRRHVQQSALVEPTGASSGGTGGRPAALFRFRRSVLTERPVAGLRIGAVSGG